MPSVTVTKYLPEVVVLSGLPASGKSTFAESWVSDNPERRTRINYDDLRVELYGDNYTFNREKEAAMQKEAIHRADTALQLGMSIIVDNTNLNEKARYPWAALAQRFNAPYEVEEINTPIWDCINRDLKREKRVGRAVIERMALFNGFIDWNDTDAYPYDAFIICDLDGTLCDTSHRQHHVQGEKKNWKAFFAEVDKDPINHKVADILDMFADDNVGILLVSGRPINPCGIPTQDWLIKNGIRYDHLFMRQGGDSRSDVIVKQEILDLLPKEQIDYVFDDRNSVVKMWRKNGLTCFQVADGNF